MLDAVWQLSSYTLQAAVTDTYADSNTRERRPCEIPRSRDSAVSFPAQRRIVRLRGVVSLLICVPTEFADDNLLLAALLPAAYFRRSRRVDRRRRPLAVAALLDHVGPASHWRDCHCADALSPSLLKHLPKVERGAAE